MSDKTYALGGGNTRGSKKEKFVVVEINRPDQGYWKTKAQAQHAADEINKREKRT